MTQLAAGFGFALLCALIVIIADSGIKVAADDNKSMWSGLVIGGCLLYATSGLLWFYAVQHVTLVQAGVAYSMFSLLALAVIGVVYFGETLHTREYVGLGCAIAAMILFSRHA
ncbi:MAG: EamA family transporter [Pseudomonadota bacterium]